MKKFFFLLSLTLTLSFQLSYSYTWEPYGPEGVIANKVCFFDGSYTVICMDTGMYLKEEFAGEFEFYSYTNMGVVDAVIKSFDSDSLIVPLSDGSWSDGIYLFDCISKQFTCVYYCWQPNFVLYDYYNEQYFVGYEYGLVRSEDGINWMDIPFFEFTTCLDMEFYDEYLVVATTEENNNTFLSDDNGVTWTEFEGENITELAKGEWGYNAVYGIAEGDADNGGFYRIDFDGLDWDNVFYSSHLSALGTDNTGTPFLGWHTASPPHEGIARYKFLNPNSGLMFFNDGLPDLNIISITAPPGFVGGNIIYCCTEIGIYFSVDYAVGLDESTYENDVSIFPNPVSSLATIKINYPELPNENISVSILNNQGQKVDEIEVDGNNSNEMIINWSKGDLSAGVYYLVIETENEQISEKFIIF